jgi:hypothetical protein
MIVPPYYTCLFDHHRQDILGLLHHEDGDIAGEAHNLWSCGTPANVESMTMDEKRTLSHRKLFRLLYGDGFVGEVWPLPSCCRGPIVATYSRYPRSARRMTAPLYLTPDQPPRDDSNRTILPGPTKSRKRKVIAVLGQSTSVLPVVVDPGTMSPREEI